MIRYLLKRFAISLIIIWGVVTLTFITMHLAPGDPASIYIHPDINPQVVKNLRQQFGLTKPLHEQYIIWLKNMLTGNFGISYSLQKPIINVLAETLPNTLKLTVTVFIFQFIAGILLGILSALKAHTRTDKIINTVMLFLYSMPGFWLALISVLIFSLKLGWLPSSQMVSLYGVEDAFWPKAWDHISHLVLPVFILSTPFIAYTTRFTRQNMITELQKPYILAAKTYGISRTKIIFHYTLKNALLPLVTLIGLYLPFLLGGAVITEYIFAWPGMGRITVNAIFSYDYPLILATTLVAAIAVVLGNLISDLLYALVDPRIRIMED